MKKVFRAALPCILIVALLLGLSGCGEKKVVRSAADLPGAKIGVLIGSSGVGFSQELTDKGALVSNYTSTAALAADLKAGTIDGIVMDEAGAAKLARKSIRLKCLKEPYEVADYRIICANENADLTAAINSALVQLQEKGIIDELLDTYFKGGEYHYVSPDTTEERKGTLSLAVVEGDTPYAYSDASGEMTGLNIEIARAVCDILNVDLEIRSEPQSELVTAIRSGRADFGMGRVVMTEENAELVDFSEPYMTSTTSLIVRS